MEKFARIIELEDGGQVLLTIDYNEMDESHEVKVKTILGSMTCQLKLGFRDKEDAVKMMEDFDHEDAVNWRDNYFDVFKKIGNDAESF